MGKLTGRVALVTGGGRGIGRAIALAFAREGAKIALTSRTKSELDRVASEVHEGGGEAFTVIADFTDGTAIKSAVGDVIRRFGQLDILMNNAGGSIGDRAKLRALEHDDVLFEQNLFLNLTSAYYATRAALPQMIKQDYGRIIFTGSGYAKRGSGPLAYTVAKHGLVGMTRSLAYQVPPSITVNTLNPGWTNTSLVEFDALAKLRGMTVDAVRAMIASENIQKRFMEPEELGPMAVLLASEEAKGITGQVISVDGGYRV